MKTVLIILICICVLFNPGCADASPGRLLEYQNYPLYLTADYACGDSEYSVRVEMSEPNRGRVVYISPPTLAGLTVTVDGGASTISGLGFDIPLSPEDVNSEPACDGVVICAMLSLSTDRLISTELRKGQSPLSVALFTGDNGNVELILSSSGKPLQIYCAGADITLKNMVLDQPDKITG